MPVRRIGILTGGGDVPGLNSVIKGVTYRAADLGYEVVGIRRGWEGLTHLNPADGKSLAEYTRLLTRENTRTIDRTGGTFLHTSRTNPLKMKSLPAHLQARYAGQKAPYNVSTEVESNLRNLDVDCLVAIGGDDTLSYAAHLHKQGVKVVAIPKTMDNDVRNTEYCIGFATAVTRAMDAINRQRSTVGSHERVGIFRVFGRDSGYTALFTAYVTSTRCAIPEYQFDLERMIGLLREDKAKNPSNYAMVVLSEGASWKGYQVQEYGEPDAFGHRKKLSVGEAFSAEVTARTGEDTLVSDLTYDLRSGEPDFVDKVVGYTFAGMAMDCIQEGRSGVMTAIVDGCYALAEIPDPALGPRVVDVEAMYNVQRYRPNYDRKVGLPLFLTRP
ncbi:MAG TPA: 6-phosphofructokinase [Methylococcaceae bacterium]|nr:6-phosphofructokinase [Methylococcaceae bacterium]